MKMKFKGVSEKVNRHLLSVFGFNFWLVGTRVSTDWGKWRSVYQISIWYYKKGSGTINQLL